MNEENKTTEHLEESEQALLNSDHEEQRLLDTSVLEKNVLDHPSYKQLLEQLTKEEQKSQELRDNWLRTQADLENLKRRTEKEIAQIHKYAIEKFANEVLTTVDNLERSLLMKESDHEALKDFYMGIELTLKSLLETLHKFGITPINPLGEKFDHEKHTAVTTREDSQAQPNSILEVIQKGYWFKDRLLRPALVVVAKGADSKEGC
jgi:molecular chaperone GrpE